MNILLDVLVEEAIIEGKSYYFDTDFRTCLIFEKIINDEQISNNQKPSEIVNLFFTEDKPKNTSLAIEFIFNFYKDVNKTQKPTKNGNVNIKAKAIYDFEYDAPYIYGAFLSQYGIDLNDIEYLHWYKFRALFKSLNDNHKIVEIMQYRGTDLSKIKNLEERARIRNLQNLYALPVKTHSTEENVAMAGSAFGGMFRKEG